MIKQVPILLTVVGIAVIIIGFNLVMNYGLSFITGISLFFGIAMLVAGVDLQIKIKKLNAKNRKNQHNYTIKKMMDEEDVPKEESKDKAVDSD